MSSKNDLESNKDTKLIRCENCRQDILSDKMFLHEGFCHRNNVFCEHCEKVFLKTDYQQHIKELPKNLTTKKSESNTDSKKSTSNEEENPLIEHTIASIVPNPTLEIVQMPIVEEISINAPIIISESGQIVSNKNKNDYLLPFFGINTTQINSIDNNITQNIFNPETQNIYSFIQLKNNFLNTVNNQLGYNTKYKNYTYNKKDPLKFSDDINTDIINNDISSPKRNNNNIIINNNIVTYNNSKKFSKVNNFFTPKKSIISEKMCDSPQDKPKKSSLIAENLSKSPTNRSKNLKNYYKSNNPNEKVPTDSKPKFTKLLTEPNINIKKKYNNEFKTQCITDKKIKVVKRCGYCNMNINNPNEHFKKCKSKININNKNKTEEKELKESLLFNNIDEFGIEESHKKILHREFLPSFHAISMNFRDISPTRIINNEFGNKKYLLKTEDRNYRQDKIFVKKDENSRSAERKKKNKFYYYRNSPDFLTYRREFKKPFFTENINCNENYIIKDKKNEDRKIFLRI